MESIAAFIAWWEGLWKGMEMLEIFAYCTVAVVHFADQNWIPKTVCCIRCVMVCKIGFTNWNAKIAFLRASMVLTYYIKLFRTRADRHSGILMSLLFLVAETIMGDFSTTPVFCPKASCRPSLGHTNLEMLLSELEKKLFEDSNFSHFSRKS